MQCDNSLINEDSNLKEILEVIREEMIKTQRPANEINTG